MGEPRIFMCDTDAVDEELLSYALPEDRADWTYDDWRHVLAEISDHVGEWQGIPVPIDDFTLRLAPGHPLADVYRPAPPEVRVIVGGPQHEGTEELDAEDALGEIVHRCLTSDVNETPERIVNEWYDAAHNRDVFIFQKADGRAFACTAPRAPDRSMDRFTMAVQTIGASDAWSIAAEAAAMEKLMSHVDDRQFRHYFLTGLFIETSKRSGLTYVFRKLRPTVVMTPRKGDSMHVLAVLCLHPIGYYDRTWAGCMTPTDDVIAHLVMMRGDEALFWRKANQHDPASPEAGL